MVWTKSRMPTVGFLQKVAIIFGVPRHSLGDQTSLSGWWWLEHDLYFSIQLGMSSSQLTSSYFSEGLKPPTSHSQLHYWQLVYQRLMIWPMKLWVPFSSSVRDSILGETLHHPASSYCILLIISRFYPLGGAWLTIPPTKTGPAHNDLGFNATFGSWMDWVKIHNDLTATSLEWWVGETIPKPPTSVQWTISQVDEHIHHHQHMRLYVYYIYIKHTYIFIYISVFINTYLWICTYINISAYIYLCIIYINM